VLTNPQLQQLYDEHQPSLLSFATYLVGSREDGLEIVNDVFIALWQNRKSFKEIKSIKSYLFSSVKNRSINHIRKKKLEVTNLWPENEQSTFRADAAIEEKEHQNRLDNLMNELPPKCRQIFAMSRIDELRYAEIAELLDLSIKTVESQMGKALKIIRKKMGLT
jgi:RNA polymerase sigma-70 factor (ECF subfamily)